MSLGGEIPWAQAWGRVRRASEWTGLTVSNQVPSRTPRGTLGSSAVCLLQCSATLLRTVAVDVSQVHPQGKQGASPPMRCPSPGLKRCDYHPTRDRPVATHLVIRHLPSWSLLRRRSPAPSLHQVPVITEGGHFRDIFLKGWRCFLKLKKKKCI